MKNLVINTYYLVQVSMLVTGLISIELYLAGLGTLDHPLIGLSRILKLALVVVFALTTRAKTKLCLGLYLPQLGLDLFAFATPNPFWEWIAIAFGFLQVLGAIYWLDVRALKFEGKEKNQSASSLRGLDSEAHVTRARVNSLAS